MIVLKVKVKHKGGLADWYRKLVRATGGPQSVKVGLPAGKVSGDIISIGVWNHEGTSRGIPPRRFITAGLFKARSTIRAQLRVIARSIILTKSTMQQGLSRVGMLGVNAIQDQIASNMPPPNAPSTVKKKGSSRTLIDTGRLRQSITWDFKK